MRPSTETVHPGMTVRDSRHRRLGHVTRCMDDYFEVKRGVFFEHVWMVPYSDLGQSRGREVNLIRPSDEEAEVLAGHVMRGHETRASAAAHNALQHWMAHHS